MSKILQVTFEQNNGGAISRTTGVVDRPVKVGDKAKLKGKDVDGWWDVVEVYELPWAPVRGWKVGGLS